MSANSPHTPPSHTADTPVSSTPLRAGIAVQPIQTYREKPLVSHEKQWIEEDLKSTLLVSAATFNRLVLASDTRVSSSNLKQFQKILVACRSNRVYKEARKEYLEACSVSRAERSATREKRLYPLFVKLCNAVVEHMQFLKGEEIPEDERMVFYQQADSMIEGLFTARCGDAGVLGEEGHELLEKHSVEELRASMSWHMLAHYAELKGFKGRSLVRAGRNVVYVGDEANDPSRTDQSQDDASRAPSAPNSHSPIQSTPIDWANVSIANIIDPSSTTPGPRLRSQSKTLNSVATNAGPSHDSKRRSGVSPSVLNSRKRGNDGSTEQASKRSKRVNTPLPPPAEVEYESEENDEQTDFEAKLAKLKDPTRLINHVQLQSAVYALEILYSGVLRLHVIGMIVDTTDFQLCYYDHSGILLSVPISIANDELAFLSTLYHLRALDPCQRGLAPHPQVERQQTLHNALAKRAPGRLVTIYEGADLELGAQKLTMGKHVYTAPSILGRGTNVISAQGEDRKSQSRAYVVKFSFPAKDRTSESRLLIKVLKVAKQKRKWSWVENLLPKMRFCSDTHLNGDSFPHQRISAFLNEHYHESSLYEDRILRLICEDKLFPLACLRKDSQYAKVFLDVLQGHRWLYDHPRILHRDISIHNIMVRYEGGVIFGVLNDFDLAAELLQRYAPTSKHCMGTLPFMAHELLEENPPDHLYRHDLESLFYVILCLCCRYNLKGETIAQAKTRKPFESFFKEPKPAYDDWYTGTPEEVRVSKVSFFVSSTYGGEFIPPVTPDFKRFAPLIKDLYRLFRRGIVYESLAHMQKQPFDDQTKNGAVTYGKFLECLKKFDDIVFDVQYTEEEAGELPALEKMLDLSEEFDEETLKLMGETWMNAWLDDEYYDKLSPELETQASEEQEQERENNE